MTNRGEESFRMKLSSLKSPDGEFELHVKIGEGNYGSVYKVISYLLYSKFSIFNFQFSIQHLVSNWKKKKKKGAKKKKKKSEKKKGGKI